MRFNMRKLAMITLAATMLMGCGKQTSEAADYDTQLAEYRSELNDIDDQIVELFKQRMAVVVDIARLKKENDQPVKNQGREDEVIARLTDGGRGYDGIYQRAEHQDIRAVQGLPGEANGRIAQISLDTKVSLC